MQEMTPEEKAKITDLKKCDFNEMNDYFKAQSEARKAMTKEEKLVSYFIYIVSELNHGAEGLFVKLHSCHLGMTLSPLH